MGLRKRRQGRIKLAETKIRPRFNKHKEGRMRGKEETEIAMGQKTPICWHFVIKA